MQRGVISISQMLRWTGFIAVYSTAVGHLINSPRSIAVSAFVASAFIVLDVYRRHSDNVWLAISYFCCGLSWAIASMLLTLACWPEPTPPRPPMPFLVAAAYVVSGQWYSDFVAGLKSVIAAMMLYCFCFSLATVTSSAIAVFHFRKQAGWKILLANTPGLLFVCYILTAIVISGIQSRNREPGWRITIGCNGAGLASVSAMDNQQSRPAEP